MRILDLNNETKNDLLESLLKRSPNHYGEYESSVNAIVNDVRERKDKALFDNSCAGNCRCIFDDCFFILSSGTYIVILRSFCGCSGCRLAGGAIPLRNRLRRNFWRWSW